MLPEDVERISELLDQGAVIVCAMPRRAPGLAGFPESDRKVAGLAAKLWNDEPVRSIRKGKLHTRGDVQTAIRDCRIAPLVKIDGTAGIANTNRVSNGALLCFLANTGDGNASFTASFRIDGKRPELWDAKDGSIRFAPLWQQKDGRTSVNLSLAGHESIFVVFRDSKLPADHVVDIDQAAQAGGLRILKARFGSADGNRWLDAAPKLNALAARGSIRIQSVNPGTFGHDPAPNIVKTLEVEYELSGKTQTITIAEGQPLSLGDGAAPAGLALSAAADGSVTASAAAATSANLIFASGKRQPLSLPQPTAPATIKGPWQVTLDSPVDAKRNLTLPSLSDLAEQPDPAARYFSGTATYAVKFEIPTLKSQMSLDLGQVRDLARVTLNGKDLGVLWQAPFTLDITPALKTGTNQLEIAVTNTWHNRLVGDEQFPADFEWGEDRGDKGHAMKGYPDWFIRNQARPERNRKCFVVWYYHRKDTKLLPTGLLGPVTLIPMSSSAATAR
jgi:hypothetical protein